MDLELNSAPTDLDGSELSERSGTILRPYRPVQWLGSKLRSSEVITRHAARLTGGGRLVDLFSGSSVISQALATHGPVSSVDALKSCAEMARAMLGVERTPEECVSGAFIDSFLRNASERTKNIKGWSSWIEKEAQALTKCDVQQLASIEDDYPVVWRKTTRRPSSAAELNVFTHLFSGTYFGLSQSLQLDGIRQEIESRDSLGNLTRWAKSVLLTALLGTCSEIVHSAGKHFAQPLTASKGVNLKLRSSRRLRDRSLDPMAIFARLAAEVAAGAQNGGNQNEVFCGAVDAYFDTLTTIRPSVVYADPPYTAQQYSRFYHVLETVIDYRLPDLGNQPTSGLYPVDRYLSPYCSKRQAPAAFERLIEASWIAGSALLLSYSSSAAGSNGNARMISLEALESICVKTYGRRAVKVAELSHRYRQFNAGAMGNSGRSDSEVLIICER